MDYKSDLAWLRGLTKSGSFASTQPERVLARILTMTTHPTRFGFKKIGGGYYGRVYSHEKTPGTVYKVCRYTFGGYEVDDDGDFRKYASDGYAGWARLCADYQKEYGKQDFLPDIKEIIHDARCSVYVMGELEAAFANEGQGWADFFDEFFHGGSEEYAMDYGYHPSWDGLVAFRDWLEDRGPSEDIGWDIHRLNIMMRGDVPVLTDPWAGVDPYCPRATSLNRKFRNSQGIPA